MTGFKGCDNIIQKKENTGKGKTQMSEEEQPRSLEETSFNKENPPLDAASDEFPKEDFPIVGIGASAGGLAAFEAFFSAIPANSKTGIAFVLIQHLDPNHKSILTELIERYTQMPVYEVTDEMAVKPDCVYIIPPNRSMVLQDGALQLTKPAEPRGQRLPIDLFFRSLAQEKQERSIGIVLSGTGSDGTEGLRVIKAEGGMVIAQAPESSEYNNMPLSAIATGLVDYVLKPEEMPAQLISYVAKAFGKRPHEALRAKDSMKQIFNLLYIKTGHDFSHYKQNTINRRIERRMAVQNIENVDEYVRYLEKKPAEVESLFRDFLIGVTSFFRNPETFEAFQEKVIPRLFVGRHPNSVIRVWVPGCSTGEEAYSIAILIQEQMEKLNQTFKVQIFATDIDSRAIEKARSGLYPVSISSDISPKRLKRFFTPDSDSNYLIQHSIREMVIFSEQDIIKDPPFSKLDLLSCRNLLIYMDRELQKKLIPLFHYALNSGGFLFLGPSESIGDFTNLFDTLDRKSKLYVRKEGVGSEYFLSIAKFPLQQLKSVASSPSSNAPAEIRPQLRELTERAVMNYYAPVSVLVDEHGDILYVHGHTSLYLELAQGEAGLNILNMAREGLRSELTTALHRAAVNKESVFYPRVRVKTNGGFTIVNLAVRPAESGHEVAWPNLFLVTFEELTESKKIETGRTAAIDAGENPCKSEMGVDVQILKLKQELQAKEESLKASNEELATSNEELKSANEEMQSVNEELQSTNEELETSREELQSVNEELGTVNTELQNKVVDLSQANNDMNNLLAGTGIGTIFVDYELRIMRFTPPATQLINLIPSDVGRPVGHIVSNLLGYDRLVEDIKEVLDNLTPKEIEVQTKENAWYLMRIRPYRTLDNNIEGAVITFTDITETKKSKLKESETMRRLIALTNDSSDAVILQDVKGNILAWNPKAEKIYGWSEAEALKMNVSSLVPENRREEELAALKKLGRAEVLESYRTQRLTKDGRLINIWLTATSLVNEADEMYAIATTEREIKS